MSKKDLAIIIGTLLYSFLFYDQNAGLNFLIFSVLLTALFAWLDLSLIKNKMWLVTAVLTVLSGTFVFLYGSALSIFGNCICLLLLPAVSVKSQSSVIVNFINGLFSLGGSIVFIILNTVNASKQKNENGKNAGVFKFIGILVPLVIILIFFFIYKSINPLFEKYTDFISGGWVLFTIGGVFIVYGLIRHERIKDLDAWESKRALNITREENSTEKWNEKRAFILLFVALNLMLVFINVLDVNYLYLGAGMPKGVTHKEFVHNGVGMLILSIVMGICVILYFFRGTLNFTEQTKRFKYLVYVWLFLNLTMIFSTAFRNKMYIDDALLTYKRIGVYYWLYMAAAGLITTWLKVSGAKSNWYLARHNSFIALIVLILSGGLDWDKFITVYNLQHSTLMASLDKRYLISLSETNIKQLYEIKNKEGFNVDSVFHYPYRKFATNKTLLDHKLYQYLKCSEEDKKWQSFCMRRQKVLREIDELKYLGKMDSLDFSGEYISTLKPVFIFEDLKGLRLDYCDPITYEEVNHFKRLEKLYVNSIEEIDIKYLRKINNPITLIVSNTKKGMVEKLRAAMPPNVTLDVIPIKEYKEY